MPVVDKFYSPEMTVIDNLVNKHYPKTQLRKLLKLFRTNFEGREYKDIDAKFKEVVLKEQAQAVPEKPNNSKDIIKERATDLENKSEDGAERAQEAKQQEGILTKEQAIFEYDSRR